MNVHHFDFVRVECAQGSDTTRVVITGLNSKVVMALNVSEMRRMASIFLDAAKELENETEKA